MEEPTPHPDSKLIALLQEKVRLDPLHRRLFYVVFGSVWLTGICWLVAEWLKDTELGPARTPLQTLSMKIHGATMLLYLVMLGSLLIHTRRGIALRTNRVSGFSIIGLNAILALTGWMLYYVTDDRLRQWNSTIHWTIGSSALLFLVGHILLGRRRSEKESRI